MIAANAFLAYLLIGALNFETIFVTALILSSELVIWLGIYSDYWPDRKISKKVLFTSSLLCAALTSTMHFLEPHYHMLIAVVVVRDFWALLWSTALPPHQGTFLQAAGPFLILEYLPYKLGVLAIFMFTLISSIILSSLEIFYMFSVPALNAFLGLGFILALISFWSCALLGVLVSNLIHKRR